MERLWRLHSVQQQEGPPARRTRHLRTPPHRHPLAHVASALPSFLFPLPSPLLPLPSPATRPTRLSSFQPIPPLQFLPQQPPPTLPRPAHTAATTSSALNAAPPSRSLPSASSSSPRWLLSSAPPKPLANLEAQGPLSLQPLRDFRRAFRRRRFQDWTRAISPGRDCSGLLGRRRRRRGGRGTRL